MNRATAAFCHRAALAFMATTAAASCSGGGMPPGPTIVTTVTVSALSLNPKTTIGGTTVSGTVTLSSAPIGSGASVSLSSDSAQAVPPATAVVAVGSTSTTFTVSTNLVTATATANISASFGGVTRSDVLTITPNVPPPPVPKFVVTGPSGTNTCRLDTGGLTLDCTFDGSTSTGSIASYAWDYVLGKNALSIAASASASAVKPSTGSCGLFSGETSKGANTNLEMQVRLTVRDASNVAVQSAPLSVTVVPRANACGF